MLFESVHGVNKSFFLSDIAITVRCLILNVNTKLFSYRYSFNPIAYICWLTDTVQKQQVKIWAKIPNIELIGMTREY